MSIYKIFSPDDIVQGNATKVTTGLWSGDAGSLESVFTSSVQFGASGEYYVDVYQSSSTDDNAEIQFSIAYGHISGAGAPTLNDIDSAKLSTQAIYGQYRTLLLDAETNNFTFGNYTSNHIYVINFQRSRLRERLDAGNWSLTLQVPGGTMYTFIDDSGQTLGTVTANSRSGRVFNVVSGSLTGAAGSTVYSTYVSSSAYSISPNDKMGFGLVYPDLGLIVLNPDAIAKQCEFTDAEGSEDAYYNTSDPFGPYTGSISGGAAAKHQYNHMGLYRAISASMAGASIGEFQARSEETIASTHYFVRLRNKEFNYSNNPTFTNPANGSIKISDFVENPKVYVTTIGLYNDSNELLAVGKLSRPVEKSFDKEALIRVRLDF